MMQRSRLSGLSAREKGSQETGGGTPVSKGGKWRTRSMMMLNAARCSEVREDPMLTPAGSGN